MSAFRVLLSLCVGLIGTLGSKCPADIIVNDGDKDGFSMDGGRHGEGWYTPCDDSYGGRLPVDFHHDFATKEQEVVAKYQTSLPKTGCYTISEWHPGANPSCAAYLPKSVPISVQDTTIHIDQSVNGGQWNTVGNFMFSEQEAVVEISNTGSDECDAGVCWWIADAVKFTYVGPTCADPVDCEQSEPVAPLPAVSCEEFGVGLLEMMAGCPEVDTMETCADLPASCTPAMSSFIDSFGAHIHHCLAPAQWDATGLAHSMRGLSATVEKALSCSWRLLAEDLAEASKPQDAAATQIQTAGTLRDALWESEPHTCDGFAAFAREVVEACGHISCCADVIQTPQCAYYATGLHSLFSGNTFHTCLEEKKHELGISCTCKLRAATACALQDEVHMLLFGERWEPDCVPILPMEYQQHRDSDEDEHIQSTAAAAPADDHGGRRRGASSHWLVWTLAGGCGVLALGLVVTGALYRQKQRQVVEARRINVAAAPVIAPAAPSEPAGPMHMLNPMNPMQTFTTAFQVTQPDGEEAIIVAKTGAKGDAPSKEQDLEAATQEAASC